MTLRRLIALVLLTTNQGHREDRRTAIRKLRTDRNGNFATHVPRALPLRIVGPDEDPEPVTITR